MAEIKAAEISAILKEQLAHFDANASLEEVGTVLFSSCTFCSY